MGCDCALFLQNKESDRDLTGVGCAVLNTHWSVLTFKLKSVDRYCRHCHLFAMQWGCTPLHVACEKGHTKCVKLLVEAGAGVNQADWHAKSPLYRACDNGHSECAKLLAQAGADVNRAGTVSH